MTENRGTWLQNCYLLVVYDNNIHRTTYLLKSIFIWFIKPFSGHRNIFHNFSFFCLYSDTVSTVTPRQLLSTRLSFFSHLMLLINMKSATFLSLFLTIIANCCWSVFGEKTVALRNYLLATFPLGVERNMSHTVIQSINEKIAKSYRTNLSQFHRKLFTICIAVR